MSLKNKTLINSLGISYKIFWPYSLSLQQLPDLPPPYLSTKLMFTLSLFSLSPPQPVQLVLADQCWVWGLPPTKVTALKKAGCPFPSRYQMLIAPQLKAGIHAHNLPPLLGAVVNILSTWHRLLTSIEVHDLNWENMPPWALSVVKSIGEFSLLMIEESPVHCGWSHYWVL